MHLAPNIRRIRKDQKGRLVMDSRSSSLRRKDSKPSRTDSNREETQSSIASCVFHIPLSHQLPRRLLQQSVELIEIGVAFDEVSQNFPWKTIESSTFVSVQRPYSTSKFLHNDPSDFENHQSGSRHSLRGNESQNLQIVLRIKTSSHEVNKEVEITTEFSTLVDVRTWRATALVWFETEVQSSVPKTWREGGRFWNQRKAISLTSTTKRTI